MENEPEEVRRERDEKPAGRNAIAQLESGVLELELSEPEEARHEREHDDNVRVRNMFAQLESAVLQLEQSGKEFGGADYLAFAMKQKEFLTAIKLEIDDLDDDGVRAQSALEEERLAERELQIAERELQIATQKRQRLQEKKEETAKKLKQCILAADQATLAADQATLAEREAVCSAKSLPLMISCACTHVGQV